MLKVSFLESTPNGNKMQLEYNMYIYEPTRKIVLEAKDKLNAMNLFMDNAKTVLDLRLEELRFILKKNVMPYYVNVKKSPYLGGLNPEWVLKLHALDDFLESIEERRNHSHFFALAIKENLQRFHELTPTVRALQFWSQKLNAILLDTKTICTQIINTSEKLHYEYRKKYENA